MSGHVPDESADAARARLGTAVERLLEHARLQRERATRAEGRVRDLEGLLARFARGEEDPAGLARRLEHLKTQNDDLRGRLLEGGEAVDRLLARIRFLEEQGR